jgi:subtilisin family serine protease
LKHEFELLEVAEGNEQRVLDELAEIYLDIIISKVATEPSLGEYFANSDNRLVSGLNVRLYPQALDKTPAQQFKLTSEHERYLQMVGGARANQQLFGRGPVVTVLDGGFDAKYWHGGDKRPAPVRSLLVGDVDEASAAGNVVHGTLVAALILEVCPQAQVIPIRVCGERAVEWDVLAGLAQSAHLGARVVNLSVSSPLSDFPCQTCGFLSGRSRAAVMKRMVESVALDGGSQRVLVAAAGNDGTGYLKYPAYLPHVIAVTSVNSKKQRSEFSSYSTSPHTSLFAAPGGDNHPNGKEAVACTLGDDDNNSEALMGTSFAAAYATGVVAQIFSNVGPTTQSLVDDLAWRAERGFEGYSEQFHGRGLLRT